MLEQYLKHVEERGAAGLPPLPLNADQTRRLCELLRRPPEAHKDLLVDMLANRVPAGVDAAAKVKAEFLAAIAKGAASSPLIDRKRAVELLGTMLGGFNVAPLVALLEDAELGAAAAKALEHTLLVYDAFEKIAQLALPPHSNARALQVMQSWADAKWFTSRLAVPEAIRAVVFKVEGEINTDDFSPARYAPTRPDIPLHAKTMGETRFPGGIAEIERLRAETGLPVAFVGDVIGTGSSRKSACNSLLWHIGEDIPHVPNKRRGGLILGGAIAPIFFNTAEDSGALPIQCDVTKLATGQKIVVRARDGKITDDSGATLSAFTIKPAALLDEYRAGGRVPLIIGKALTERARKALGMGASSAFISPGSAGVLARKEAPPPTTRIAGEDARTPRGYTLAQKLVGRACGVEGVLPGAAVMPKMTTVGSQDTTGPMTAGEIKELACLKFQCGLFMQSFCHTAAYPTDTDKKTHQTLPEFVTSCGGVALKPGDGVIHSWLNRMILPDTVGTGGDSHTRFPMGISFPAGSGAVAFAAALGVMPIEMPESVLVRFSGAFHPGITLRDAVNAIPYFAIKQGMLTVAKKNKKNAFNGRILEMEGLDRMTVDQAYELADASAERSAAACAIELGKEKIVEHLCGSVALLQSLIAAGYQDSAALRARIEAMEQWLAEKPALLQRDPGAEFAARLDIDLGAVTEPILCCPNDPDDVKLLSEVAGRKIDEVFIGSCMLHLAHFRAATEILKGASGRSQQSDRSDPSDASHRSDASDRAGAPRKLAAKLWIAPPTRMDRDQMIAEGVMDTLESVGARIEIPGCSLCMGNQARVADNATVFSTSTRNFDNRMGTNTQVFLGSAEVAAVCALLGRIPTPEEYRKIFEESIAPYAEDVYRPLKLE